MSHIRNQTRRIRHAPGLFVLLALLGACDPTPAPAPVRKDVYGNLMGPLHTAAALSAQAIAGVRLGMTEGQAAAALARGGFTAIADGAAEAQTERSQNVRQRRFWIAGGAGRDTEQYPEHVGLSYVEQGGQWIVAGIAHHHRIPAEERRDIQGTRRAVLARFGQPSLWKQEVWRGELWDEMDYVSADVLRDRDGMDTLKSCHRDWQCQMVLRRFDCRDVMRMRRGLALKISFGTGGNRILYELNDFARLQAAHETAERYRNLDLRGAFCEVPSPASGVPQIVTVPE